MLDAQQRPVLACGARFGNGEPVAARHGVEELAGVGVLGA